MKVLALIYFATILASATSLIAEDASILRVSAIGKTSDATIADGRTLREYFAEPSRSSDLPEFTTSFNADGWMMTTLVDAAMRAVTDEANFRIFFDKGPDAQNPVTKSDGMHVSFPWYKPNCTSGLILTDRTTTLCNEYFWSEPIYENFVGYYGLQSDDRTIRKHSDVIGATICLSGYEFRYILHEVGLSSLNANLIVLGSPAACLRAVAEKRVNFTFLPIDTAARYIRDLKLEDAIEGHHHLDRKITLNAVAHKGSPSAISDIGLINNGLNSIKNNGQWFGIIAKFTVPTPVNQP